MKSLSLGAELAEILTIIKISKEKWRGGRNQSQAFSVSEN